VALQTQLLATLPPRAARPFLRVVDGVTLHWLEYGCQGTRPPVVLLHGLNDAHLTWWQIAPELGRDRRVFVLDLPGHGLSDRPDVDYTLAWYGQIVAHWIESLDVPPVDIVGHSLGGGIALVLLRVCRSRIRRLVLAAPGGLGREISFVLRLASLPRVVELIGQPFMGFGTWLALRRLQPKLPRGHIFQLSAMNTRPGTARALARTTHDLMDWRGQRHSFLRHAHEIADLPPITVLWGNRDSILPIAHGRALARDVEGVRFEELIGCGHFLHHDDSAMFLRAVRDALDAPSWPAMRLRAAREPGLLADGVSDSTWLRLTSYASAAPIMPAVATSATVRSV
jgi:pimeloyl-ACP methyl ester carboxylesterase